MDQVHPDIATPTSVTHFICPKGPKTNGVSLETHHLVYPDLAAPRPSVCAYCGMTRQQLAEKNQVA
jgi:hypothetical protein